MNQVTPAYQEFKMCGFLAAFSHLVFKLRNPAAAAHWLPDAKLAVSTAGQRWGGRLLVMLWAAHKGSLRSAPH